MNCASNREHQLIKLCGEQTFDEERTGTRYTPYLYNAKELDEETGLYYYGARYYDPRISMFYGVDPYAENYMSFSPYAYVGNNPLIRIDPDGRDIWEIDGKGNATLLDTKEDEIYVNGQLITKFKFDTQEKLDALSTIASYYYNQNSGSESLSDGKVSILSYKNYRMTGSSNWSLDSKPYDREVAPLGFSYSRKQFGTDSERIALTVNDGLISSSLDTKWNMRSIFIHENVHLGQPLDVYNYKTYAAYFELDAYKAQMQHNTWNKTTRDFKGFTFGNVDYYLNQLKGSTNAATQNKYQEYLIYFNSKR